MNLIKFLLFCNSIVCSLEWWSFEVVILLGGLLPNPELETSVLSVWYAYFLYILGMFVKADRIVQNIIKIKNEV